MVLNIANDTEEIILEKNDSELVKLTLVNQNNFLYIVKKYKSKLFNYIRKLTNVREEEIEDILQNIFIKTYLNLNDFDNNLKFSSWIYRIAHNEVINNYRKIKARPQCNYSLDDKEILNISSELNIEKNLDLSLLKDKFKSILKDLDNKYREIIILKYFEQKSYEEISDIIQRPIGTVSSLLNKARNEFKKELIKQNIKI